MLADITVSTEVLTLIGLVLASMAGALGLLFRTLITNNAMAIQSVKEDRDSWKQMANEGIENLEKVAGRYQRKTKAPKVQPVAAVVPEHQSPPTKAQKETAETQTARQRLVAATLALALPSRMETETEKADIGTAIEAAAEISAVAADEIDKLEVKSKKDNP